MVGSIHNKWTVLVFIVLFAALLPESPVSARSAPARENMLIRSHQKGKRNWDETQEGSVISTGDEASMDTSEDELEPKKVKKMWLDMGEDFRESVQISRHSDGELVCEAVGSPPPKVFWYRNGTPLESITILANDESMQNRVGIGNNLVYDKFVQSGMANVKARLPIRCALPEDEGQYTCIAINRAKQTLSTTYLSVIDEVGKTTRGSCDSRLNSISSKKLKKGTSAFIANSETFHMELMGKHISLPCKTVGRPRPKITWFDQELKKIVSGKKFQVSSSGSLLIRNLAWKDMGVYTCISENIFGKETTTTFVYPLAEDSPSSES